MRVRERKKKKGGKVKNDGKKEKPSG